MFYYKKEDEWYYVWADKIVWKFWPFLGIFCKNKYFWTMHDVGNEYIHSLEKKYPWYKYSFWETKTNIFIIHKSGIERILDK